MLTELARGYGKNTEDISYHYFYKRILEINRINDKMLQIDVSYVADSCGGDVWFRQFNIQQLLCPSNANLIIDVLSLSDNTKDTLHFNNSAQDRLKISRTLRIQPGNSKYSVKVADESFYFDSDDKNDFDRMIALIDEYHASNAIIDTALNIIYRIDQDENLDLITILLDIFEAGNIIDHLENRDYYNTLKINEFDPLDYQKSLNTLAYKHRLLINSFMEKVSTQNIYYGSNGITNVATSFIQRHSKYFDFSYQLNFYAGNTYYPLGRIILDNSKLSRYYNIINEITKISNHNRLTGQVIYAVASALYKEWLEIAEDFIKNQNYNDASEILINAYKLCEYMPFIECTRNHFWLFSKAKYGIYDSYIRIAEKGLLSYQPDVANNYLVKAYDFQKQNSEFIITDLKVIKMFQRLLNQYLHLTDVAMNSGYYNEALEIIEKIEIIDITYLDASHSDELAERRQLSKSKIDLGLQTMLISGLADAIPLDNNDKLEIEHYSFKEYTEVNESLSDADLSINKSNCYKYQLTYYNLYINTKNRLEQKEWLSGGDLLDELIRYNEDDTLCFIVKKDLTEIRKEYEPTITYERKVAELKNTLANKEYQQVFKLQKESDSLFNLIENKTPDIHQISLKDQLIDCDDKGFLLYVSYCFLNLPGL